MRFSINNEDAIEYTFADKLSTVKLPEKSYIEISGVKIDLSFFEIINYSGPFDRVSLKHFTKLSHKIKSKSDIINSDILIADNKYLFDGYPSEKKFRKENFPVYFTSEELRQFEDRLRNKPELTTSLDFFLHERLKVLINKWHIENLIKLKGKFNNFINQTSQFPVKISCLYDDRKISHTTHLILNFTSAQDLDIQIDNTISPFFSLFNEAYLAVSSSLNLDLTEFKEKILPSEPSELQFSNTRKNGKPLIFLLAEKSNLFDSMLNFLYQRIITTFLNLGFKPHRVLFKNSDYLQRNDAINCVPFALQNKIDSALGLPAYTASKYSELGAKLRSFQAILSYLLTCENVMPKSSDYSFQSEVWYLNFAEVCARLDMAIKELSFEELRTLYLAMDLDDTHLHEKFKRPILDSLVKKRPKEDYSLVAQKDLELFDLEELCAPNILCDRKKNKTYIANFFKENYKPQVSQEDKHKPQRFIFC